MNDRVYLHVPYHERDLAKAAGARWDNTAKRWFAADEKSLPALAAWINAPQAASPVSEFAAALKRAGLILDGDPVMDGQLKRVPVEGDDYSLRDGRIAGERSGAYVGHLDGHPAGFIQNFRSGQRNNWKSSIATAPLSAGDRERLEKENATRQAERLASRQASFETVADRLSNELTDSTMYTFATADHPYLVAKGLTDAKVLTDQNNHLVIPAADTAGRVWTVQRIDGGGSKRFEKDGQLEGHHHVAAGLSDCAPLVIAEGWATAETIRAHTNATVVTAFTAYNLESVARTMREQFPDRAIVIAGDNDHRKALELDERTGETKINVGKTYAEQAATAVRGVAALPDFEKDNPGSDWNDWWKQHGGDALRKEMAIAAVLASQQLLTDREAMRDEPEGIAMRIQGMVNEVQGLILGTATENSSELTDLEGALERGQRLERNAEHVAVNTPLGVHEQTQAIDDAGLELGLDR
jgi:putative DNA primase/helicase